MQKPVKTQLSIAIAGLLASALGHAGAFSLYTEGSASAVGNYAAGVAAEVADASTGWYNPAGLVFLGEQQLLVSGVGVFPSSKLAGNSTFTTPLLPSYSQTFSGVNGAKSAVVPAFHYAQPLGDRAAFGFSMVSPFGLSTDYGQDSPVRYSATLSELMTVTVSPEIAGKLTDELGIGLGLDLQGARVKFNRMLGAPTLMQAIGMPPMILDSESDNKGQSFGIGFHAGVLGAFNNNHTRLGVNYQSKVQHTFHGTSTLTGRLADDAVPQNPLAQFEGAGLHSNNISLPDILTLSAYHDFTPKFALMGSAVFTGWSVFKEIDLNGVAAFAPDLGPVVVNSRSVQNYRDTWRFALGANYQATDEFKLRVGAGYDQTPTVDAERDVRLPDANRWALAIGGHYQMKPSVSVDLGYTYLFANKDTFINKTEALGASAYHVNAQAKPTAHLLGLQAAWTIDAPQAKYVK